MRELATLQVLPRHPGGLRSGADVPRGPVVARRTAMSVKRPADESTVVDVQAAPAVTGAVVSRRVLFGRLAGAERVVQISAPAGSGKTVLARLLFAEVGLRYVVGW